MKRKISASPSALVREIEELQEATSANLKERWRALYRSEPPRRISRDLLIRALAYRITGTKWSGPLFFGLKANRQERTNGAI